MWMIILAIIIAAAIYAYSIRNTIKISKPSCGSCPHKQPENIA